MEETPQESLHEIANDIKEGWEQDFAVEGISEIEKYLKKQADFLIFLAARNNPTLE